MRPDKLDRNIFIKKVLIVVRLLCLIVFIILANHLYTISAQHKEFFKIPLNAGVMKLIKPIDIVRAEIYRDGGTISISVKDSEGTIFSFCLDARVQIVSSPQEIKTYPIFINAAYPDDPNGELILMGGPEEKLILEILQEWINRYVLAGGQKELPNVSVHGAPKSTDERDKFRIVLRFIDRLKSR